MNNVLITRWILSDKSPETFPQGRAKLARVKEDPASVMASREMHITAAKRTKAKVTKVIPIFFEIKRF